MAVRKVTVQFRVTEAEMERIRQAAEAELSSLSAFARRRLLLDPAAAAQQDDDGTAWFQDWLKNRYKNRPETGGE